MGGDKVAELEYINHTVTKNGHKMKIIFFERTQGISSTDIRRILKEK